MSKCSVDNLANIIVKELTEYSQEVTDNLKLDVKAVAKDTVKLIKAKAPKDSGDYKKGWGVKVNYEGENDIRVTVRNKTNYQLTHLLEYGHKGQNGTSIGSAPAYPHIRPAEIEAEKALGKKVKIMIKKG